MNQKIQELLDKATYNVLGVKQVDQKQFAELIVNECIEVIENSEGYSQYFPHVTENIENHFGVKE